MAPRLRRVELVFGFENLDAGGFLDALQIGRHLVLQLLLQQGVFDVGGHFFELDLLRGDFFEQPDDVVTKRRCHDVADLIGLQREGRRFELRHERIVAGKGVFAFAFLQAPILRVFQHQLGKILAGPGALEQLLDFESLDFLPVFRQFLSTARA